MKILYVEDNDANAFVMRVSLKQFDIQTVADGESALELAKEQRFDLILMDINLGPGKIDGCETMKQMRELEGYLHTPFFATTAYALPDDEEKFRRIGFDDYFSKPIDFPALISRIKGLEENLLAS